MITVAKRRFSWAVSLKFRRPKPTHNQQSEANNTPSGFTLIELLVVMAIIAVLTMMAVPAYKASVRSAKEAVLRTDLRTMRDAIEAYTYDKQKSPQSLDDLVQAGYLRAIPKDPITSRNDTWAPAQGDMLNSIDETQPGGIDDVHSGAQEVGSDGTNYSTW